MNAVIEDSFITVIVKIQEYVFYVCVDAVMDESCAAVIVEIQGYVFYVCGCQHR